MLGTVTDGNVTLEEANPDPHEIDCEVPLSVIWTSIISPFIGVPAIVILVIGCANPVIENTALLALVTLIVGVAD